MPERILKGDFIDLSKTSKKVVRGERLNDCWLIALSNFTWTCSLETAPSGRGNKFYCLFSERLCFTATPFKTDNLDPSLKIYHEPRKRAIGGACHLVPGTDRMSQNCAGIWRVNKT